MKDTARKHALIGDAAAWHDRMACGQVDMAERAELERWLAVAAEHRAAYQAVARTHEELLRSGSDPRILELRHEAALRLTRHRRTYVSGLLRAAAAALLTVGVGFLTVATLRPPQLPEQVTQAQPSKPQASHADPSSFATGVGERLSVNLDDGSHLTLSSETQVRWSYSPSGRRIDLLHGQALFEVAKDPHRPFVVHAGERQFIALGTAFDVRLDGQFVQITMVEGHVRVERVSEDNAASGPPQRAFVANLSAGEQLTVDASNVDRIVTASAESVTSWRDGQVIFADTRLADAVAEFNRHSRIRITLAHSSLNEVRISGAFQPARPHVFVDALTTYFPIRVASRGEDTVVLAPAD